MLVNVNFRTKRYHRKQVEKHNLKDRRNMKKGIFWLRWVTLIMVSIGLIYGTEIYGAGLLDDPSLKRADVIKIDIMTVFGDLEKSPVEFLHDAHTKALASKKEECTACHIKQNDRIYPKFKRLKDEGRIEVMNIYHEGCISCHGELKVAKEKAGPVECDDCHAETDKYLSSRQPMVMDKFLHCSQKNGA